MNQSGGCGWDLLRFESVSPSHGKRHDGESTEWDRLVARLRDVEAVAGRSPSSTSADHRRGAQRLLSRTMPFSLTNLPSRKIMLEANLGRLECELEDVAARGRHVVAIVV